MNGFGAIEWLARGGFLVKGVLYMVVGALALQVTAKVGGRVTGTSGALTTVLGQPFGRTLLLVAAIGLLGYAAWRVLQGLFDPDGAGHDWRGVAIGGPDFGRTPSPTGVVADDDLQRALSCRVFEGVVRLHDVIQREGVCHQPATDIPNLLVRTMRGDLHDVRVIFGQPGIDPDGVCL